MTARTRRLLLAAIPGIAVPLVVVASGTTSTAAPSGWIRLAHLSPDTPSVDVYLYPFGAPDAEVTLKHVGYGAVSPYQQVNAGRYTVAMRGAGADPESPPVISTNVEVTGGEALTVAGMGRTKSLTIRILEDSLTAPDGKASIRLIQASLRAPVVDVATDAGNLSEGLRFPDVTSYLPVAPGSTIVRATAAADSASLRVRLDARSTHTIVVLDGRSTGIRLVELTDASGSASVPAGGVNTGLGGTATAADDEQLGRPALIAGAAGVIALMALVWRIRRPRPTDA
jgi:Domain of unknown function (DUF4397)